MAPRVDGYRKDLRGLNEWEPYLKKNSGLPGPRANLELVQAVGEEADADRLWRLSASSDEFLALCGTAGLGKVALMEPDTVMTWLRELAADGRWRVREGVAIALQRIGRENMPRLLADMQPWWAVRAARSGGGTLRAAPAEEQRACGRSADAPRSHHELTGSRGAPARRRLPGPAPRAWLRLERRGRRGP
jgi:hypothetical protein